MNWMGHSSQFFLEAHKLPTINLFYSCWCGCFMWQSSIILYSRPIINLCWYENISCFSWRIQEVEIKDLIKSLSKLCFQLFGSAVSIPSELDLDCIIINCSSLHILFIFTHALFKTWKHMEMIYVYILNSHSRQF